MGYFIKGFENIADIEEPAQVSLSDNPNFITFSSKPIEDSNKNEEDKHIRATFSIKKDLSEDLDFNITFKEGKYDRAGTSHKFEGTRDVSKVSDTVFFVDLNDRVRTVNNFRECLMKNSFFGRNFHISPPFEVKELENGKSEIVMNENISLIAKGEGSFYSFTFMEGYIAQTRWKNILEQIDGDTIGKNSNTDTIFGDSKQCQIYLDVYSDNDIFLGVDDKPLKAYISSENESYNKKNTKYGTYITSLSKSYVGQPLWFNLNAISSPAFVLPPTKTNKWENSGTIKDYRIIAQIEREKEDRTGSNIKTGKVKEPFFLSHIFYQLTGYDRTLEKNDLTAYVYNLQKNNQIKLLTTQPELTHTTGQHQYLNFILSDSERGSDKPFKLGLLYKFYASHGGLIGETTDSLIDKNELNMVNTIRLNIDPHLATRPAAARVEVCLCRYEEGKEYMEEPKIQAVSNPLSFRVMPDCLYKVHDFAFLNRLGGWSSFNFSGTEKTDFKTKATTIYQTHTPDKTISSEIESVYGKEVSESFTVETMPIAREVCDWLRELSTSKAVYELSTGRYIIVDDLNIKHDTKDELFRMEMKYHYSDSYNARIE